MNEEIFNECEKLSEEIVECINGHDLKVVSTSIAISVLALADTAEDKKNGEGKKLLKGFIKVLLEKATEL